MLEAWLLELAKGIGKFFLNPLLYWAVILVIWTGWQRIRKERYNFGIKVYDVFSEWRYTWKASVLFGLGLSLVTVRAGMVFSYEVLLLLSAVIIILSITGKLTFLSASYTIGITYLFLLILPALLEEQTTLGTVLLTNINLTALVILLGIFLIIEGIMLTRTRRDDTYPGLGQGNRGGWIGVHHVKKLAVIPFFVLIPAGLIEPAESFWPYFSIGGESYGLLLFPFLIGYDHKVRGNLPSLAAKKLAKPMIYLGIFVLAIAIGSIYIPVLTLAAVIASIFGREFINYRFRVKENETPPFFRELNNGCKVLAVIPGTPADRLDILPGETVTKVNGSDISSMDDFYYALQKGGAYFKLELLDDASEKRFVQGALYEGEHHELGIIFTEEPHQSNKKKKAE
ncbi:PDZ domain-containing protein [Virgibacillus sp. YIM 98842]|uniref:PDZ domain-containing protein n=1 Tax=Virgibacillus sp. YIM 98842 TaxID=2663533 RepID=UPI0013DB7223|nr:PDZ domain-containing protein [Virgibacillus sp. YIM 98842]